MAARALTMVGESMTGSFEVAVVRTSPASV
jgi:hypothetical protein